MNTNLCDLIIIPLFQPYNTKPWAYAGTKSVVSIPNPEIVDWVLVELRDALQVASVTPASAIARQAAFLLDNGSIVGMDGAWKLKFDITVSQNLCVVVYHRNNLGIMSAESLVKSGNDYVWDFTSGSGKAFGGISKQKEVATDVWAMYGGDGNCNNTIDINDKVLEWQMEAGSNDFLPEDYDMNSQVNNQDKDNFWFPNMGKESAIPE